jgi:RNA polymerase sigma-70 factor (ECF subfamily)
LDSRIIALLQKRDELALHEIRSTYGKLCKQLAFRILGNPQDAEECVSDMLLAVWNSRNPIEPHSLKAYLISLTRHAAMDKLKARQRQKRGGTEFETALDELAEILPSGEQVEKQIEERELIAALTAWLRTLSPEVRSIFMQRYFMSEPVQAIAEANHMSVSAVKMTLMRTRNKLKDYLRKEELL